MRQVGHRLITITSHTTIKLAGGVRDGFRGLLANGQFEFVTGGWVKPDEAKTALYAL